MPFDRITRTHYLAALGLFVLFFYIAVSAPPRDFPTKSIITVRKGAGLYEVAQTLKDEGVIRNAAWFRILAIVSGHQAGLHSGDYYLPYTQSVYGIAGRIFAGDHEVATARITVPEGYSIKKIAQLFDARFALFNKATFTRLASEGYLFPDTYFIGLNATATSTIDLMTANFKQKTFPLSGEIAKSGHSENEIITMASILELEAQTDADRRIVAGILWKRLALGMPLQVDSTLTYVTGKTSAELTQGDLAFSSPYNTYIYKGLPPTPIGNPGLESIEAALRPATSTYLYFLSDNKGVMHYAKTFEQHVANKVKYLAQ